MKLTAHGPNRTSVSYDNGTEVFFSYNTPVAGFEPGKGYFRTDQQYSQTTTRHIKKYLQGMTAVSKAQADIDRIVGGA